MILRKTLIVGFHFSKFGCCKEGFWGVLGNFFRINLKNNSLRIALKILSKKVKLVVQRRDGGTGVAVGTAKENKINRYKNSIEDIFTIF